MRPRSLMGRPVADVMTPEQRAEATDYMRGWRTRNREKVNASKRRSYWAHREEDLEKSRQWRLRNPERVKELNRRHYSPERRRLTLMAKREYARTHSSAAVARAMLWNNAHPEVRKAISARRRARRLGATGTFTPADWARVLGEWAGLCAYCGMAGLLEADHRTPLSRGGSNDVTNILPACRRCNAEKSTRTEEEYRARRLDGIRMAA